MGKQGIQIIEKRQNLTKSFLQSCNIQDYTIDRNIFFRKISDRLSMYQEKFTVPTGPSKIRPSHLTWKWLHLTWELHCYLIFLGAAEAASQGF